MTTTHLKTKFLQEEEFAMQLKTESRQRILEAFGSIDNFRQTLSVNMIDCPDDARFKHVYSFYTTFFTLPEETESYKGFESTLALNHDKALAEKYGKFREAWLYATLPTSNEIIAGINFSVYELDNEYQDNSSYAATGHIIYIFVKTEYRCMGMAKHMISLAEEKALNFIASQKKIIWFCEQNAPEKMSPEEYFADNINALIDQCDRLIWWDNLGYKRLQFNYVQPPLNPGQQACTNLTLNVKASNKKSIPSYLVKSHLERFFMIAVYKGDPKRVDDYYTSQMDWLKNNRTILLEGNPEYYTLLKRKFYE
jgi:ribosomal protein S18 acetylase RimI-like enzyme